MSPSVNRSSDSPESSGAQPPKAPSVQAPDPVTPTGDSDDSGDSQDTTNSAATADSTEKTPVDIQRQQPIPPPSEPMQYRAIGLIRGQYMPSAEQLTRGTLLAADGTLIDAVLLGRVMSLVKNHLSLEQPHLWVVYPRSRQEDGNLHVQIVGVWEPEKLNRTQSTEVSSNEEAPSKPEVETSPEESEPDIPPVPNNGYFSIRGEVIYHSREQEQVIVKIKQSPRRESEKIKFFKLKLKGTLGERVVGHFWDFQIQLQASTLAIQEANDIGLMPLKKRPKGGKKPFNRKNKRPDGKKNVSTVRPMHKGEPTGTATPPKRREPLPKPVKRGEPQGGGGTSGSSS